MAKHDADACCAHMFKRHLRSCWYGPLQSPTQPSARRNVNEVGPGQNKQQYSEICGTMAYLRVWQQTYLVPWQLSVTWAGNSTHGLPYSTVRVSPESPLPCAERERAPPLLESARVHI